MKIDAQLAPVQRDRSQSVEAGDQTTWQLAWQRELERAQRSQAQHAQPSKGRPQDERRSQHSDDAPLAQFTARPIEDRASSTPEFKPVEHVRVDSAYVLRSSVREDGVAVVLRVPEAPLEPSLPSVATSVYAFDWHERPSHGAQPSAAAALDALIARMQRLAWMPKAAHVSVQGSE